MNLENRILVAVDFSPASAAAFREAKRVAAWYGAPLTALHVVTPARPIVPVPVGPAGAAFPIPTDTELVDRASRLWTHFARECGGDAGATFVVEVGAPRDRILEAVQRDRPRMLIVGAAAPADAHRGIGPTATACAQRAATQVMVVRAREAGPFRSIVACVDIAGTSREALEQAIAVAGEDGGALHVLHVFADPWGGVEPPAEIKKNMRDFADAYRQGVEKRVREFCEPLAHELAALKPQFHALQASSHAEGIMAFIATHRVDLAVLGTRGKFNLRDYFWGSTAERVVREAECSVLAVKPAGFVESESYQPLADTAAGMGAVR